LWWAQSGRSYSKAAAERVKHKPTANMDADDHYLLGLALSLGADGIVIKMEQRSAGG
jgi:hypothetical protein